MAKEKKMSPVQMKAHEKKESPKFKKAEKLFSKMVKK